VLDVRSRSFKAQAHRQSLAVANSQHTSEDQEFVDSISDWNIEQAWQRCSTGR
jgi:antidote-toxin recognition MazE-like antitoxin